MKTKNNILGISAILISFLFMIREINAQNYWTKTVDSAEFSPRNAHQVVMFNDKLWLFGRPNLDYVDIWTSGNAIHWEKITDSLRIKQNPGSEIYTVVFNNQIWLFPNNDEIWNSSDGVTWKMVHGLNNFHNYIDKIPIVFKGKIWITGGWLPNTDVKNLEIRNSEDGINWNKVVSTPAITNRCYHSLVVFRDKLWLIAGYSGGHLNDIWSTEDGTNWQLVKSHAAFPARHCSKVVVYNGKLWLIGGMRIGDYFVNDIWCSENGEDWIKTRSAAEFSPRMEHQVFVFKDTLWLIGGLTGNIINNNLNPVNDIWYSADSISTLLGEITDQNYSFYLSQNYPNPFNPETVISYTIGKSQLSATSDVELKVFDILGKQVAVLVNEKQSPGSYNVIFNASGLSSGVYLYKLTAGQFVKTNKMILMR